MCILFHISTQVTIHGYFGYSVAPLTSVAISQYTNMMQNENMIETIDALRHSSYFEYDAMDRDYNNIKPR